MAKFERTEANAGNPVSAEECQALIKYLVSSIESGHSFVQAEPMTLAELIGEVAEGIALRAERDRLREAIRGLAEMVKEQKVDRRAWSHELLFSLHSAIEKAAGKAGQ